MIIRQCLRAFLLPILIVSACRSTPEDPPEGPSYAPLAVDTTQSEADRLEALFAGYDPDLVVPISIDTAAARRWVEGILDTLTLEEKIGQLIIVDLSGGGIRGLFSDPAQLAVEHGIGGFLVPRLMSPRDVHRRTQALQRAANIPLFFAADYERGVGRFNNPLTEMPSNMALGATRDEVFAAAMGRLTAIESRAIGVNLVFAPVVDVNNNPANPIINVRSYGEDGELVGRLAAAYVREAQRYGLATTLKHFPGHGDTEVDTHSHMAVIEGDRASLDSVELRPYQIILDEGIRPAGVMSAHLWVPAIDEDATPATFSRNALSGLLRGELGFDGFIVTDDIKMGALQNQYSFEERILSPLRAGADVILTPADPVRAIRVIRDAVDAGRIPAETIDASVRRVLWAKARAGLYQTDDAERDVLSYLLEESRGAPLSQAIADEAVTVLRSPDVLPLSDTLQTLLVQLTNYEGSESIAAAMSLLEERQRPLGLAGSFSFHRDVRSEDIQGVMSVLPQSDVVIVALYLRLIAGRGDAGLPRGQARLVRDLIEADKPVILITFGNPYAVTTYSEAAGHVVAYDQSLETVRAVHRVLSGELAPSGRLPITVDPYPYGAGLDEM